ncbi:MAG TPA: acyltransferase, partial [Candidatus Thermoplasmatota archaeon]|nr:acyltransferase [Candidatus Thermoplasmatota archaeon]
MAGAEDSPSLAPPALAPVSTTQSWIPALQSLRGVAALWVVLFHVQVYTVFVGAPLLPIPTARLGWLGVDLFFVLSAYLLGQPFLDGRKPATKRFLADRFLRVAPAYYASFAVAVVAYVLFAPDAWYPDRAAWSLVFLQNFDFRNFLAVNPAFWSLAVELQFYLILPFMARLFRGPRWPLALAACVAVSLLYRGLLYGIYESGPVRVLHWEIQPPQGLQWETFTLPSFLGHFAFGLAACRIRLLDRPAGSGVRRATFLAGVLLVAAPAALWIPPSTVLFTGISLAGDMLVRVVAACGFACMVLATASGGWIARALAWRPLQWLGQTSYSLYLIHIPVQVVVLQSIDPMAHPAMWAVAATGLSIVAGWLLYVGVEAPAEAWRRRRKLRAR